MNRYILGVILLLTGGLWGFDVPIDKVQKRDFSDTIEVNSQIVQRANSKESIMARMGGKVKKYFVEEGESIKKGQLIATIESLELSRLSSELQLLRKQLKVHNKNYKILKKLYDSGLESMQNLNREERERDETASKIESTKQQLTMMGVSSQGAIKSTYQLYAQNSGKISKILASTNSIVNSDTPLVSIIKGSNSTLIKSFIPMRYASNIKENQKGEIKYGEKSYPIHINQILPELDSQTQQIVVLSSLDKKVKNLFLNRFVETKLYIGEPKKYLSVKKTALSFFNNEWVVFVPEQHEDEHDKHESHEEEHEEEEVPYDIRVVKILKEHNGYVAIEGLKEHEEYVSDRSYYIKSMLLKSSLGGHGH